MLEGKPKQFKSANVKLDLRHDRIEKVEPASLSQAKRSVSFSSLLANSRAVWKSKSNVFYSTAGANPEIRRMRCLSGKDAKRVGAALLSELRKAQSDDEYNGILALFLRDVTEAWPEENKREQHVHKCDERVAGQVNPDGTCECGFDWKQHQMSKECNCDPKVDGSQDAVGKFEFIIHRTIAREVIV